MDIQLQLAKRTAYLASSVAVLMALSNQEEFECDKHASTNPLVLLAGARPVENRIKELGVKELLEKKCNGIPFKLSERLTYLFFNQHPHPQDRVKRLLARAQELEAALAVVGG